MSRNLYTENEVVLCLFIALYGTTGQINYENINKKFSRSVSSLKMKVKNIAAMLDEEGIQRYSDIKGLSGLPTGRQGRKTNRDIVEKYVKFSKIKLFEKSMDILND